MYDSLRFKNTVMVYPDQVKDRRRAELIKKQFAEAALLNNDTLRISPIKEVFWNPKDLYGLTSKLSETETNIIIAPSDDQAFVTRLLTSLHRKNYQFQIVGLQAWDGFDNIDVAYLHDLNVRLVMSEFVDMSNFKTQTFPF